jgi:hypothetical protein
VQGIIWSQWKLSVKSWRFWLTVFITVLVLLLAMQQALPPHVPGAGQWPPRYANFFMVNVAALGAIPTAVWDGVFPILAVLPAGDGLAVDRRVGADATFITRVGWPAYLWGRLLGNALAAVTASAVGIIVAAVTALVRFPVALPRFLGWAINTGLPYQIQVSGVFGDGYVTTFMRPLFWSHPWLYLAMLWGIALWVIVGVSGVSIAAAWWVRRPVIVLAIPTLFVWVGNLVAERIGLFAWAPSSAAGGYLDINPPRLSLWALLVYWAIPALAAAAVISWGARARREWPGGGYL